MFDILKTVSLSFTSAFTTYIFTKRKYTAEAKKTEAESWIMLTNTLSKQVHEQNIKIDKLYEKVTKLEEENLALKYRLMGIDGKFDKCLNNKDEVM